MKHPTISTAVMAELYEKLYHKRGWLIPNNEGEMRKSGEWNKETEARLIKICTLMENANKAIEALNLFLAENEIN